MTDFKTIAISEIRPDPDQPRKFFDKSSLDELTSSVKKDGVLEPIMIRPNGKGYIIVYGERRFKAATAAGLKEIPAQIRELTPDEAFEFQITENLHRKDVHPMEEANSYERLQKKDPVKNIVKELAARFAKSEIYVTQRLSFNNLIPEFQKEFYENKFSTGHAILLSRLTKDDQFLVKKEARGGYYFSTVSGLNEWIERNIMRNLSKATFKQEDATLFPEAGPCITCTKRSGSNQQLFPDVKEKDRCFDKKCFEKKSNLHFNFKLKEIIETRPEILIISSDNQDANKPAMELLKSLNVKVLKSEDYQTYSSNYGNWTRKAKGFCINGYHRGEISDIYLKGKDKDGKKITPDKPAKVQIAEIQDREKRSKELDLEKIHLSTITKLQPIFEQNKFAIPFQPIDRGIMIFLLIEAGTFMFDRDIKKLIPSLPQPADKRYVYDEGYFEKLSKISDNDLAILMRKLAWDEYGNKNQVNGISTEDTVLRIIARYLKIDLDTIEAEQKAIAEKRFERSKKRIAELQSSDKKVKVPKSQKPQLIDAKGNKKPLPSKKVKKPNKSANKK